MSDPTNHAIQAPPPQTAPIQFNLVQAAPPPSGPKKFDLTQIASVDKSDLTAIVTARHEAAVRKEIQSLSKSLDEASRSLSKTQKSIQDALEAFVLAFPTSPLASLQAALTLPNGANPITYTSELSVTGSFTDRTPSSSWARRPDQGSHTSNPRTSIQITSRLSLPDNNSAFTLYFNAPIPDSMAILFNDEIIQKAEVARLDRELLNARQRLTNMASIERAARAAIAENALRSSGDEGLALLNSLSGVQPMALLPETRAAHRPDGV
jgi:hypothetical protein